MINSQAPFLSTTSPFLSGWYRLAPASLVKKNKIYSFNYFGTALVCYRKSDHSLSVFNAYCPHLGAHLGMGGKIKDDQLICPFHGWQYNSEGQCVHIPYCQQIPKKAQLIRYPAQEVGANIFIYFNHLCTLTDIALDKNKINTDSLEVFKNISSLKKQSLIIDIVRFEKLLQRARNTQFDFLPHGPGFLIAALKPLSLNMILTTTPISTTLISISWFIALKKQTHPLRNFLLKKSVDRQFRKLLYAEELL